MLKLVIIVLSVSLCSCGTTLNKFGHVERFAYNKIIIDKTNSSSFKKRFINYARNTKENCFREENNYKAEGDVITVKATDLDTAINYFYKNKATWNIKEIKTNENSSVQMIAETEMNIKYEVSYCSFQTVGFHGYDHDYASFRMIK